jgi:intracellular multiplication protein IcmQ
MNDELTKQQVDAILNALDDAIQQGPWGTSSFLRVIGKNLLEIREGFAKRVDASAQQQSNRLSSLANQMALRSAQRKVYIVLYSFEGSNIKTWERIVANLPRQMISRPVYSQEDDAIAIIKTKENKNNEAYIVIYINESDILPMPTDKLPHDKLGKQLLTLKDKSLKLDNIDCFVHQSGVYHYTQGRLVKDS